MKTNIVLCLTLAMTLTEPGHAQPATPSQLSPAERAAGWRLLFDGRRTPGAATCGSRESRPRCATTTYPLRVSKLDRLR